MLIMISHKTTYEKLLAKTMACMVVMCPAVLITDHCQDVCIVTANRAAGRH